METIRWAASDADGDPLTFTILYSPDEGIKWYPVANRLTGNEYAVDVGRLPGGTGGKILLIVSDGFHTVQAQSAGTFTVPHAAPIVVINTPADGQTYLLNDWLRMSGSANDMSGATAANFTYIWSIDGEMVDVGAEVNTLIEEGQHTITLAVYDDFDNFGEDTVVINVAKVDELGGVMFSDGFE